MNAFSPVLPDHRVLGRELELFCFRDDLPGLPLFLPRGATVYQLLLDFMRALLGEHGYGEVRTPQILPERIWHQSGHYENFAPNMFFVEKRGRAANDQEPREEAWALKPMNCPGHVLLYASRPRSHRELPMRIAEMGLVHRREPSGARHGLFRVQAFVQDDAHHFCRPDQVAGELDLLVAMASSVYALFGLPEIRFELSTRPVHSIGTHEQWRRAEEELRSALERAAVPYELRPGEGAFYGPKIDLHLRDAAGRWWQCGTIQLDFSLPDRFDLSYIDNEGEHQRPVMIHRACYGSVERFFGMLLEHHAGALPPWLAPVQVAVLTVSERFDEPAKKLAECLRRAGLRVDLDLSDERLANKVRLASLSKVPYVAVVGAREAEAGTGAFRTREGDDWGPLAPEAFVARLPPFTVGAVVSSMTNR